ncbi:MAG: hypothetical protein JNL90_15330 [Planctomycetes bacterium]|nr:hypothetical protein [Planctomycetota bacterium]
MLAAHLAYQLLDLLIAALALWPCIRLADSRPARALGRRLPRLLGTPLRRRLLLGTALYVAVLLALLVATNSAAFDTLLARLRASDRWQRAFSLSSFVALGAAWLGGTLLLPLVALWTAWRTPAATPLARLRRRRDRTLATAFAAALFALFGYACFLEPNRLVVERARVEVADWPAERPPLRIVLFSDLQSAYLGARERRVPELIAALEPDLIVIAGDLVAQSFDETTSLEQARWVLSRLAAPLGVYVVNGDVDNVVANGIEAIVEGMPVTLLDNESVVLPCEPPIELLGIDPPRRARMATALAQPAKAELRLGLVHRPRHWAELSAAGCALVMAGHTHGGQVVVPGFGPPVTFEIVPRHVAAGGLHRMSETTQLYVTRGVGREGGFAPQIRILCPPEITLIELHGSASATH